MNRENYLFYEVDLDAQLRMRQEGVNVTVNNIRKEQFLISSNAELIQHIESELYVEPLNLHEDLSQMRESEVRIDVSGDTSRYFSHVRGGPFYVSGTKIDIDIPFSGAAWIFRFRTNPWSTVFPRATVNGKTITISIALPHDADQSRFKTEYDAQIDRIREYVKRSRDQTIRYNEALPRLVAEAVNQRRDRLGRHNNIAALLDIPLTTRPGVPSIVPVKLEIRRPTPLPVPPKSGLNPEPGISDATFEQILLFIRHQGRTFERTPATFAVHDEEDLRNIILAQLNGHFEGGAVGEAFRNRGKTDISIEQDNRSAFVGECKIWTGSSGLSAAIDQLLGYLTWRDSKASIIIFNTKNKDFSNIMNAMPASIRSHPMFLRDLQDTNDGEWRIQMRSKEDEGRRVTLHCFLFNLYSNRT